MTRHLTLLETAHAVCPTEVGAYQRARKAGDAAVSDAERNRAGATEAQMVEAMTRAIVQAAADGKCELWRNGVMVPASSLVLSDPDCLSSDLEIEVDCELGAQLAEGPTIHTRYQVRPKKRGWARPAVEPRPRPTDEEIVAYFDTRRAERIEAGERHGREELVSDAALRWGIAQKFFRYVWDRRPR